MTKLSFDEFKEKLVNTDHITDEDIIFFKNIHGVDLDKEVEQMIKAEYDWYLAGIYE